MNYSHYLDENGRWWWCLQTPDGSVVLDSGAGYESELECLEAITKIKATNNGDHANGANAPRSDAAKVSELAAKAESAPTANVSKPKLAVDVMLGESPVASVFTTKDNQLRWSYKDNGGVVPERLSGAITEFNSIMAAIKISVPKQYQKETYFHLGKALFAALSTPAGANPRKHLRAVRLFVAKKAKEHARLVYVIASLAATTLMAGVVVPLYFLLTHHPELGLVVLCGWFGAIGASISVLQRNSSLDIDPWMSDSYLKLQGVTRIILGFIFGCIFVLASKANFVLGVVRDTPYQLLVLCIVAGFSERLIPELLSKFESSNVSLEKATNNDQSE